MMNSKKHKRLIQSELFAAVMVFCASLFYSCGAPTGDLQVVRTEKVERGDLLVTVTATGTVQPYNRVEIKAPIAGRVEEVLVNEGDEVKQGQVLARMSSVERAALLDAARSKGDETVKRWEEAYKPAPLLAPLDGMIIVRSVEPGQTVATTDPVVVLSDRLIVEALVDETDLAFIQLGQPAEITLDAYRDKLVRGKVDHITFESQLENNVNVYEVDVAPEEVPESFRSGMTANITFIIKDRENVLLVPSEAVVTLPQDMKGASSSSAFAVYKKVFGGKLEAVPIQIGETDGQMTEVTEGLKEGAEIVIVRRKEKSQSSNPFGPPHSSKKNSTQKSS